MKYHIYILLSLLVFTTGSVSAQTSPIPKGKNLLVKADLFGPLWFIRSQEDFRFSAELEWNTFPEKLVSLLVDIEYRSNGFRNITKFWPGYDTTDTGWYSFSELAFHIGIRKYFGSKVFGEMPLNGFFIEPQVGYRIGFAEITPPFLSAGVEFARWNHFSWRLRAGAQFKVVRRVLLSFSVELNDRRYTLENTHEINLFPEINIAYQLR